MGLGGGGGVKVLTSKPLSPYIQIQILQTDFNTFT